VPGVRGQAGGAVSPKKLESETIVAMPWSARVPFGYPDWGVSVVFAQL
jgi:hypothetical protein